MVTVSRYRRPGVFYLLMVALGIGLGYGMSLLGGVVVANWEGPERETYISQCYGTERECGTFCVYPRCTWCNDCSCVCCAATRTNEGCYCSAPCECWEECDGEEPPNCWEECEDPVLFVFQDCGDICVEWEYLLYVGSNQPGRPDGVVDNPFHVDALGDAMYVIGQPYEGAQCMEELLPDEERMTNTQGGVTWPTVIVQTDGGPEALTMPLGVGEGMDDLVLGMPSGVSLVEYSLAAGERPASISHLEEIGDQPGLIEVNVSGYPSGSPPLFRYWTAGQGLVPLLGGVFAVDGYSQPFEPWGPGTVVDLYRGWYAFQAAYMDGRGEPVGWSAVEPIFSRGGVENHLANLPLVQPEPEELVELPEGIVRPPGIFLGEGVVIAGTGRVSFPLGSYGSYVVEYRLWAATGGVPDREIDAPWRVAYINGGNMELSLAGPEGDQFGDMAVQVRLRRYEAGFGYVYGRSSDVRFFWVEPRLGHWVPVGGNVGEYQWVESNGSPFHDAMVTPVPTLENGDQLPGRPSIVGVRRFDAQPGYITVRPGGLQVGTWLEYRLWPSTGFAPVDGLIQRNDSWRWRRAYLNGGELRLNLGGREMGGYGQWMSVQLRQARAGGETGLIGGNASEVIEVQVPAVLRRPLGE